jgi:hypothetical protein
MSCLVLLWFLLEEPEGDSDDELLAALEGALGE